MKKQNNEWIVVLWFILIGAMGFLLGIMFGINLVSAWSINYFNNSLTDENLSFSGSQNFTRYLTIPNTVSYLLNANITLSGFGNDTYIKSGFPSNSLSYLNKFCLYNLNNNSVGITTNGSFFWSVDDVDDTVYRYYMNGTYIDNFGLTATNTNPTAITNNGTFIWVVDNVDLMIYKYYTNGTYLNFFYSNDTGTNPQSITTNNTYIWIGAYGDGHLVKFDMNGNNLSNIVPNGGSGNPNGIINYRNYILMIDAELDRIYRHFINGTYMDNQAEWRLETENVNSTDFFYNNGSFYVSDIDTDLIYRYSFANFSNDSYVMINNTKIFNTNGRFNQYGNTTSILSIINGMLNSNFLVGSNYIIPILFHSETGGLYGYVKLFFNNVGFLENSQSYNTTTTSSAEEKFIINFTYDSNEYSSVSGKLNYNSVNYLGTLSGSGNTRLLTATITAPAISGTYPFYWNISLSNSSGSYYFKSNNYTQTVNPLIFQMCNDTYNSIFWNITFGNESNRTALATTLDGTIKYFINDETQPTNYSVDTPIGTTYLNYTFCGNTNNTYINAILNIGAGGFYERTFYFNKLLLNNTYTNTTLYLQDAGTYIIGEVTDTGLVQQEGIYVNIYRYYPEIDKYLIIEKDKTDELGQFVARLVEGSVKYQFEFLDSDNNVLKRTNDMTIACRTSICVIPFVIEDSVDDFNRFENVSAFTYSLTFTNSSNTFIYSWEDTTGDSITNRLLVQRVAFNGTTTVCNTTSTSLSSSLSCAVGNSTNKYRAQAFRKVNNEQEQRITLLNAEVGGIAKVFGLEGLFWGFILLFTLIGVGAYNPSVGAILYMVGVIGLGILGVVSLPIEIIIADIVLGVIFIWAIRT